MKERPIIFSGESVRAILAGRKTQTRRVVKPQPPCGCYYAINGGGDRALCFASDEPGYGPYCVPPRPASADAFVRCPLGQVGDRLWVKETFQPLWAEHDKRPPHGLSKADGWALNYVATGGIDEWHHEDRGLTTACTSPLFMPRWASRLTLEITRLRVERVAAISHDDALAEGYPSVDAYAAAWDALNAKREAPWADDPWVWVLDFRRLAAAAARGAA